MITRNELNAEMHDSSTASINLKHGQEQHMNMQENDFSISEVTHQSMNAQIELATEHILMEGEKLCAILAKTMRYIGRAE